MSRLKDPKIQAILETLEYNADDAMRLAEEVINGSDKLLAVEAKSVLAIIFLSKGMPEVAIKTAEDAVQMSKDVANKGSEVAALNSLAKALVSHQTPELARAMEVTHEALALCAELQDTNAMTEVYRTIMSTKLMDKQNPEARRVAEEAVAAFRAAGDTKGEAAAQLLRAEACISTRKSAKAIAAAQEACRLYKVQGDRAGQAEALSLLVSADFGNEQGQSVWAAGERVALFRELGDQWEEARATVLLAEALVARIALKLATCSVASVEDTLAALRAARDGHALCAELDDAEGMESAMGLMCRVLMYNGVPGTVIERLSEPKEIYQDVMSGKYTTPTNAFPPRPQSKQLSVEEVVPTAKQLNRGKFAWNNPTAGSCYTMMWQPAKDREVRNKKLRGSYDIMTLSTGAKTMALSNAFTTMSNDANEGDTPMVVYISSHDCSQTYASNIMSQMNTLAAMITARLSHVTFVQLNESQYDWTDTRCRQVNMHPVTLALLRSCRLEAPQLNIGYVCGDACSWIANPAPLIESLFDTLESDETELMYKRGEAFAPLLVHRPLDDAVQYVKPQKAAHSFMQT